MASQRVLFLTTWNHKLGKRCKRVIDESDTACRQVYTLKDLGHLNRDLGVSVGFRQIIKPDQIKLFKRGIVNLHTGYLPWNRGAYPNVWPLIDGSPAGVTLHWMDEGIDTGPIIAQERVTVDPWDTAGSLYDKLNDAAFELFRTWWPKVLDGTAPSTPQPPTHPGARLVGGGVAPRVGSVHRKADLREFDGPYLEDVNGYELVGLLRARTFPGQPGLKLCVDGQWVEATINLKPCEPPNENR